MSHGGNKIGLNCYNLTIIELVDFITTILKGPWNYDLNQATCQRRYMK